MKCQRNNVQKIFSASLAILASGVLLFTSACGKSNSKYECVEGGFSISTNGFEATMIKDDFLVMQLLGTEEPILVSVFTENKNIEEEVAFIKQLCKTEGNRVLKEKETKNSFEMEMIEDKSHCYFKLIQRNGKLFTIRASAPVDEWNNVSKKLMACVNSFSITKPSENKSNSKMVYKSIEGGFSISANGFKAVGEDGFLVMQLLGTEEPILVSVFTENKNIEEEVAFIKQLVKTEGNRVLKEKETKNSFEMEMIVDELHYYVKLIQRNGKLFTIHASAPADEWKNVSKKLMACVNSFSITKPSENKKGASALVGRWIHESGATRNKPENLELLKDGTGVCDEMSISWKVDGKRLIILSSLQGLACDYNVSSTRLVLFYDDGTSATFKKLK